MALCAVNIARQPDFYKVINPTAALSCPDSIRNSGIINRNLFYKNS